MTVTTVTRSNKRGRDAADILDEDRNDTTIIKRPHPRQCKKKSDTQPPCKTRKKRSLVTYTPQQYSLPTPWNGHALGIREIIDHMAILPAAEVAIVADYAAVRWKIGDVAYTPLYNTTWNAHSSVHCTFSSVVIKDVYNNGMVKAEHRYGLYLRMHGESHRLIPVNCGLPVGGQDLLLSTETLAPTNDVKWEIFSRHAALAVLKSRIINEYYVEQVL